MRILVTGANGFIGSALCAYLTQMGHEVRRGVRAHDGLANTFETTSPDRLSESVRGIDCVIHLAGQPQLLGNFNWVKETGSKETNVQFARRLALLAHHAGARRFVFVSSIKVCGAETYGGPFTEEVMPSPVGPYAIAKWEAEQALREIEKESGIEVVIVRPPLVYGEGVRGNFLKLLKAVYFGIPLPVAQLTNKRSFIFLPNLVSALAACAVHPKAAGETFHVSDDQPVTLSQLLGELAMAMGRSVRIMSCPKHVLIWMGKLARKQHQVSSAVSDLVIDSTKIRGLLDWSPAYTFHQGLRATITWYLDRANTTGHYSRTGNRKQAYRKVCQLCAVDFTLKHLLLPLVDGLLEKGWSVTSVCSDGKHAAELRRQGYRHFPLNISRNIYDGFSHLSAAWLLYRLFRRERFDVLHVHTPVASLLGRIVGKLAGIPLIVYTAHGFYFHDQMPIYKYRFYLLLERLCGYLTDLLFTQSGEDAALAVAEGIADRKDVVDIGNGVCVDLFDPSHGDRKSRVRAALGVPADAYVIGVVARLVKEKGLVEFIDAAVQLAQHFPALHFLLVGERLASDHDASIERELQDARQTLGSRLMVVGYRPDVPDLLGAMDVFCLPSYREGMPRSIIEAMMMELPVVATNIRGSREEVVDGETGLLVPTRSSVALVQALGRLIADPDLSRRMGKSGRLRALKLYNERHVVARQIEEITARCCHV